MAQHKKLNIVLIGSGNVATQMGLALIKANHNVIQVYSRSMEPARTLALKLRSSPITSLNILNKEADLYIVSIKDDAIKTIAKKLKLKDKLLVHTSGSIGLDAINNASKKTGVLYPLQTLSKNKKNDFKNVPLCVEGKTKAIEKELILVAQSISQVVQPVNTNNRKQLHLAAVFACNFTNHMYALAYNLLKKHKLPFEVLLPLIQETADKINYGIPARMQTGPAIRNDKAIMKAHLTLLSKDKRVKEIYKHISNSIKETKIK